MALETERCSPQNASSPGPNESTQNPGSNGGSCSGINYADNSSLSAGTATAVSEVKSKSAFHQIALLTQKYTEPDKDYVNSCNGNKPAVENVFQSKPPSICSPLQSRVRECKDQDRYSTSPEQERGLDSEYPYKMSPRTQDYAKDEGRLRTSRFNGGSAMAKESEIMQSLSSYPCHVNKFNPEFYISQIQNFPGLPFNPFVGVFPAAAAAAATRLPLKMQLYNTPNFSLPSDYMLGLQNAKLMCEVLQMQNLGFDRTRAAKEAELSLNPNGVGPEDSPRPMYSSANSDLCTISRPDSPCSSVNSSSRYYGGKNCSCSPSSKGVPSRSPSPNQMAPCAPLPFSVDNILKPEFGKTAATNGPAPVKKAPSKRSASPVLRKSKPPKEIKLDETPVNTKTDSMSPRTIDFDDHSNDKTDDSSNDKDANGKPWPAWVYCTRYSDRPSSEFVLIIFKMRRLRSMNRCRSLKANVLKREAVAVKKTANRCRTSRTNVLKREVVPVKKKKPSDKCVTCGLAFSSDFNLARHRRNAHSEQVGEFKCLHCSRSFILESRLKMHVSIAHFRYQCSLCPSSFKNEAFKTLHEEKMHSGNSNYVCKICNSTFNKMNSLAYHMSRHHSTSKQTSPRAKLDAKPKPGVMKAVSAAKTTKNGVAMVYANELCCSYCPKFLSHPESKVRHEKLHTGNHPYACKFCKASFHLIDTWRRHERVCLQLHTALWCKFCDFYTFETASLVMHYRKRHGAKFESPAELEFLRRECLRGPTADVVPERDACSEHDESETSEDGAEMEQDDHVGSDSDGNFEETFQNHVPEMFSNNEVPVEDENAQRSRNVGISRINGGVVRIIPSRDLQSASEESDRIVGAGGEYNVQSNRGTVIAQISDKLDEMFRNCVQPASENTTREKIDATVEVCSEKNVQRSRDASISQINDQLHEMFRDDADQLASEDITRDKIDAMVEVRGGTNAHRSQDPSISRINDQLVEIFGDDDDQPASENATRETILETVEVDGESNAQRNQNADISQINDQLEEMFQDDDAVQPVSEEINAIEVSTNVEQPACEIAQSQPIDDLMRVLQSSEIRPVEQIKPQLDTIVEQKVVDSQSAVREDLVDEKWIKYEVEVAQLDNKLREIFQNDKIIENYATSEYEVTQSPEPCRVIDLTTEDDEHEHPIITIDDD